jgi:hypothetical protein
MHNQIDHILTDRRWNSIVPDVQIFRGAKCDTDNYLLLAKVRERLAVRKQNNADFIWRGSTSRNVMR